MVEVFGWIRGYGNFWRDYSSSVLVLLVTLFVQLLSPALISATSGDLGHAVTSSPGMFAIWYATCLVYVFVPPHAM